MNFLCTKVAVLTLRQQNSRLTARNVYSIHFHKYDRNTIFWDYEIPAPIVVQFKSLQSERFLNAWLVRSPRSQPPEFRNSRRPREIRWFHVWTSWWRADLRRFPPNNKHAEHPTIRACPLCSGTVTCTFKIKHSIVVLGSRLYAEFKVVVPGQSKSNFKKSLKSMN